MSASSNQGSDQMKKITTLLVMLLILLGTTAASIPAGRILAHLGQENILYSQDFNTGEASEWSLEPGWQIVPSEGGYALSGLGHVWARTSEGPWTDYFLRFRVKLDANAALHANVRVSGAIRYFIGVNRQGMYLSKQTDLNEFRENLAQASGLGVGWHLVQINASGGNLVVLVDNQKRMNYTDPDPLPDGRIAFESLSAGRVWVDDVQVGELLAVASPTAAGTSQNPAPTVASPAGLKWVRTGGPLGGLGYDVRMRPDNPDVMFVTDAKAGVFKSTDGGKTWQPANQGITARTGETGEIIPIFCLTIDPHNPDVLWAGTQNQRGVFKSVDGGASWKEMDSGITEKSLTLRGFTVDPASSDIVYTAGEVASWEWSGAPLNGVEFDRTKGVVYKTINGGKIWKRIWSGDNLARYIWIDPRNSDVLYVSTGIFDREAANSDPQTRTPGGVGILKSTDGGKTWQQINQGLANLYVGSLFMHPLNPDVLLAGVGNVTYPDGSGVYLTTDGGTTWQRTLDAYVINSVEIATANPNIAYAGSFEETYRSEDGGRSWRKVSPEAGGWGPDGNLGGQPIDFQADPRNPDRLFANAYGGGNFLSEDGGKTWVDASQGYTGSMVRDILVDPKSPAHVFAAARSGIFVSRNGGESWSGLAFAPFKINDWHAVAMDPRDPQKLLSEITCGLSILRSTDGGSNWTKVNEAPQRVGWRAIEFAPSNPDIVYAGSAGFNSCGSFDSSRPGIGVQVSTDGGARWVEANDANTRDASVAQLAIHPQDAKTVFAATFNRGLLVTSDGGKTWQNVAPATFKKDRSVTAVKYSPEEPALLLAGRFQAGLLRSEDGGKTWKTSAAGLNPEATITDILFDPNDGHIVYLADLFSGVYRSTDSGETWHAINQGLLLRAVNALALSSDGQHLYAASEGQGVFRTRSERPAPRAAGRADRRAHPAPTHCDVCTGPGCISHPGEQPSLFRAAIHCDCDGAGFEKDQPPPAAGLPEPCAFSHPCFGLDGLGTLQAE